MKKWKIIIGLIVLCGMAQAALVISSSTADWTKITYGTNSPDVYIDQQTGLKSGDLVGNASNAAFYTKFDNARTPSLTDGTLAFRVRLNEAKNYSKLAFGYNLFVGMDADRNGSLDLFLGIDNVPGGTGMVAIWNPGTGANTGPSTTTIVSPPLFTYAETAGVNYHFAMVTAALDPSATSFDLDGAGNTDVFLSFSLAFADVVSALSGKGISINQDSAINYVMATATQANSLNMDLNGVNGGTSSTMTFAQLGGVADTFSPTGVAIPEPAAALLFGIGGMSAWFLRRNKKGTAEEDAVA